MDIAEEISNKTNLPKEEIYRKIEDKYAELSGMITKEGAALLVARELGAEIKRDFRAIKMKDMTNGMKNVSVKGRIVKISNINEFKKSGGSEGKVANITIGDETGLLRLTLWNDQTVAVENSQFRVGDVVQIFNGFVKQNPYGYLEISLGKYGGMKLLDDTGELPGVGQLVERNFSKNFQRVKVEDLAIGNFEIYGTIIKIFSGEFIFKSCPVCGSSVKETDGKLMCANHGEVEPQLHLSLSSVLDDGSGDIRVAFFRDVAEQLTGLKVSDIVSLEKENRLKVFSDKALGRDVVVSGKVKRNSFTGKFDVIAASVKDINPLEESKKLVDSMKTATGA